MRTCVHASRVVGSPIRKTTRVVPPAAATVAAARDRDRVMLSESDGRYIIDTSLALNGISEVAETANQWPRRLMHSVANDDVGTCYSVG